MPTTTDHEHLLDSVDAAVAIEQDDDGTVRVFVDEKRPEEDVPDGQLVAENADESTPTDVEEIGVIEFEDASEDEPPRRDIPEFDAEADRHERHRPVLPGVSEINHLSTAATAGPLARVTSHPGTAQWDPAADVEYVRLSNSHVYSRSGAASFGEEVVQPSPMDGGDIGDATGVYVGSVPMQDGCLVDVAARTLAEGLDSEEIAPHDLPGDYGHAVIHTPLQRGDTLVKSGRTTGVTTGEVRAVNASVRVNYGNNRTITFRDQIITTDMSDGGDSGSGVYHADGSEEGALRGLLFAGSDRATVLNHIDNVEDELGVEILTEKPEPEPEPPAEPPGPPTRPPGRGVGDRGRRVARGRVENPDAPAPFEEIDLTTDANANIAERDYHVAVEMWLSEHFGSVEHEYYFQARRWADFIVQLTPDNPATDVDESMWFAVEVENSFSDVSMQADLYAGLLELEEDRQHVTPITIIPEVDVEQPELDALRRRNQIVVFPVEQEAPTEG